MFLAIVNDTEADTLTMVEIEEYFAEVKAECELWSDTNPFVAFAELVDCDFPRAEITIIDYAGTVWHVLPARKIAG